MDKTKNYVFVYGTLKTGGYNHSLMGNSKSLGEAITVGANYTMRDGGFPMVAAQGDSHVKGELFEVTDLAVLQHLDWLEGVPHHFDRHYALFSVGDNVYNGFMYVAAPDNEDYVLNSKYKITPDENNNLWWPHAD